MEENKNIELEEQNPNADNNDAPKGNTIAELQAQIQQLMLDNARLKRSNDKNASEASNYKKQLRAKQSEEEQASMEKAEREAEREEKYNELLRKSQINDFEKNYLAQGYKLDEATKMATAEVDGDFDTKFKIMSEVSERKKKEYEAEWLKTRPQASVGAGDKTISKEQFNKMTLEEKSKLFSENRSEYDRLKNI